MDRKLATVEYISELRPIPGADRIELAIVRGWSTVVKKGEFRVNDKVVFAQIDSILPFAPWSSFLKDKNNSDKPIRLRTVRLRGVLSQGLCLPLSILPENTPLHLGNDVAELLGITKYEPPIPAELAGNVKGKFPFFIPKTDTQRVQSFPEVINELLPREVYVGIKVDGTSSTYYFKDGEFGVCGRNWEFSPNNNTLWKMAEKYDLSARLKGLGRNLAIQAECYGEGIQKNLLGIKGQDIAVFDLFDINQAKYLDYYEMVELCSKLEIPTVKYVYVGKMKWDTVTSLLSFADEQRYPNGSIAEGIVIRPTIGCDSIILGERMAIKAISNKFLAKNED